VAPHAGWYYSGAIAARSAAALDGGTETVAVIGGHLGEQSPGLFAEEDEVETPLGAIPIDGELRRLLEQRIPHREDRYGDNTVEVLLPMVRFFFPHARLLWVRFPASLASLEGGKALFECAASLGRKVTVLGSTDLTHYGPNYGFLPRGLGAEALDWVRQVNDARFLEAVLTGDAPLLLRRALEEHSSCSPGAVLGALGFVEAAGAGSAALLEYGTSADVSLREEPGEGVPDSFVGYASLAWHQKPGNV
jgi:AmmeMemoRadiSam system protein B